MVLNRILRVLITSCRWMGMLKRWGITLLLSRKLKSLGKGGSII